MATCTSCAAPIVFVMTESGRLMPVDAGADGRPAQDDNGIVLPTGKISMRAGEPVAVVKVIGSQQSLFDMQPTRWRSHFVTCPNADVHRRRTKRGSAHQSG